MFGYVCLIAPLVWLAWLATRSYQSNTGRLILAVFGLALYGYFAHSIVVPLTDIYGAHVYAVQKMIEMTGSPMSVSPDLATQTICYLGLSLVAVILLLLWLQRSVARIPARTRSDNRHSVAEG
jgi:hypothetical protein